MDGVARLLVPASLWRMPARTGGVVGSFSLRGGIPGPRGGGGGLGEGRVWEKFPDWGERGATNLFG